MQEQHFDLRGLIDRDDRAIALPAEQRSDDRHDQYSRRRTKGAQPIGGRDDRHARQEGRGKFGLAECGDRDQSGARQDRGRLGLHPRRRIVHRFRADHPGEHHDRRGDDQHSEQHRRQPRKVKIDARADQCPCEQRAGRACAERRAAKADDRARDHERQVFRPVAADQPQRDGGLAPVRQRIGKAGQGRHAAPQVRGKAGRRHAGERRHARSRMARHQQQQREEIAARRPDRRDIVDTLGRVQRQARQQKISRCGQQEPEDRFDSGGQRLGHATS